MEIDTGFWYFVSFAIFVGAAANPLKKIITQALKNKSLQISQDLTDAEKMKAEAELLLKEAKEHKTNAKKEAQDILDHADSEAERARKQVEQDIKDFVKHQEIHLEDRIKQLEITAVKNIHDHMVEVAVETTQNVVKDKLTTAVDQTYTTQELEKIMV